MFLLGVLSYLGLRKSKSKETEMKFKLISKTKHTDTFSIVLDKLSILVLDANQNIHTPINKCISLSYSDMRTFLRAPKILGGQLIYQIQIIVVIVNELN